MIPLFHHRRRALLLSGAAAALLGAALVFIAAGSPRAALAGAVWSLLAGGLALAGGAALLWTCGTHFPAPLYYNSLKSPPPATILWGGPPGGYPLGPPTPRSAFGCGSAALYYSSSILFLLEKILLCPGHSGFWLLSSGSSPSRFGCGSAAWGSQSWLGARLGTPFRRRSSSREAPAAGDAPRFSSPHAPTILGALGVVILAPGGASVAGYLPGLAAISSLGFVALGLGVMALAGQFGSRDRGGQLHWLALAVACGGLTLSLCLGYAYVTRAPHGTLPVILIGAVISVLLASIVQLAFASKRRADAAELANAQLVREVRARRRAQEILRATYSELAVIHANAPVILLVLDDQFRVEKANAPASRLARRDTSDMLGLSHGAAIGCLNSLSDPQGCGYGPSCSQCPIRLAALDSLYTGARHQGVEAWVPVSDGRRQQQRCLLVSTAAIELDHSKKVLICAQDMTEHKRDELELQRQARLIDLARDAIIKTDARRVIQGWNTGAEEIYGWKVSEARGQVIHALLKTQPAIAAGIDVILSREGRWEGELVHTCRDGRQIVVESRHVLVRDQAGATVEILEINRDITGRKKAQQELSQAYRRTTVILESISDGFNFFDRDWRYTYVNPAGARLARKTREELLGKNLWELWPHAADSSFGVAYRRAVEQNIPVQVEAFYPEPLNAWFEVRCYPSSEGLSLFFTDTTARKRDEEKLRETVRALESALAEKTVLLKEVHHRVKNNLAVIASLLNMRASATENPEARLALEESQQRVHSMALIHEHLYSGDHLDRIEFSEYARELVEQLYSATVQERKRISFRFDSDPIELGVDRAVPCALILNELLSNVFKHAFPNGRKGKVSVSLKAHTPGTVELAVEDDGVGLPPDWEKNSKSLGWQIVRILSAQLDGSLAVEPCSGTRFVLRFPQSRDR